MDGRGRVPSPSTSPVRSLTIRRGRAHAGEVTDRKGRVRFSGFMPLPLRSPGENATRRRERRLEQRVADSFAVR